jgi:hypothetical protein
MSSVCASAMALLRVPIRSLIATMDAPFGATRSRQPVQAEHKTSLRRNANAGNYR